MVSVFRMKKELILWSKLKCLPRNAGLTRLWHWVVKTDKLIVDHRNALGDFIRECAVGVGMVGNL